MRSAASLLSSCLSLAALLSAAPAAASSSGSKVSTSFGAQGCNQGNCHSSGVAPKVELTGPASLEPGQQGTFTLRIIDQSGGDQPDGGLDVAAPSGTFALGGPDSDGTKLLKGAGGRNEVVHKDPKVGQNGVVSFSFLWKAPADAALGTSVTLTGWGNAVDGDGDKDGDRATRATHTLTIQEGGQAGAGGAAGSGSSGQPGQAGSAQAGSGQAGEGSGGAGGAAVVERCADAPCGSHAVCVEPDGKAQCVCDEGFTGAHCELKGPDHHRRTLLMPGLADPDVLAISDDLFVLTGTSNTVSLPFFASTDLVTFTPLSTYDPSALDPAHSYCDIWAPDLSRQGDTFHLYFSARRVAKGSPCAGQDVTTFHATAPDQAMNFGAPALFDSGGGPAGRLTPGCSAAGCERTVRIDSAIVGPPDDRWFFYVWFDQGNNVSSFRLGAPGGVVSNAGPARFALPAADEAINEGPDVFSRDGRQYFFFSSAWYNSQYAMFYVMGDSIGDLTRQRAVRRHSRAQRAGDGRLVQSHGHNSVVARRGEFFNVFHQGAFDGAGHLTGRSTFKQRMAFRPDGSLHSLNLVDVRWGQLPGHVYSLDAVKHDGTVIGPCIGAPLIGDATAVTFNGVCPSAGDLALDKGEVAAWRLYMSNDGTWARHVEIPYDGVSDDVFFDLPGGTLRAVSLRWNEKATHTEYSIDVRRPDGTWVAPCVADVILGTGVERVFDGSCPSAKTTVAPGDVTEFRVCSALNDDWAHATCGSAPSDGHRGQIDVVIP